MTHEELVEKVASEAWERMRQENLRENGDDLGPWFTPTPDWEDLPEAEHEAHYLRLPYVVDATAAISVVTEEAAKTETTLLTVIADIREALGVGCKPMLTELPEVIRDLRRRIDELDE